MKKKYLSYAQELEDLILYDALNGVEKGFYIDVGANDPWILSVTKSFYDLGYCGINIEPLDYEFKQLVEDRPRDINLCVGVGDKDGELLLCTMGTGSSVDKTIVDNAIKNGVNATTIPIFTLTGICDKYLLSNQNIDFCKIDVEGFEKEVLLGFDLTKYRPNIFVIESAEPGTTIPSHEKWEYILLDNDYELAYSYGVNRYYTDKKISKTFVFIGVDKLLEKYEVYLPCQKASLITSESNVIQIIYQAIYCLKQIFYKLTRVVK